MTVKFHDVIEELIDASTFDEAKRHLFSEAVREHYKDDIESLSDEEKELRRAPILATAGTMPAIFVGGITQQQLDNIINKAVAKALADKAAADAQPQVATDTKPAALPAPAKTFTQEEVDALLAKAQATSAPVAPTASSSGGSAGNGG